MIRNFPTSGSINDLPESIMNEFLDKVNHIKREGMWEKFKEIKEIYYSDAKFAMYYSEGDIFCFKLLENDELLIFKVPFEQFK